MATALLRIVSYRTDESSVSENLIYSGICTVVSIAEIRNVDISFYT